MVKQTEAQKIAVMIREVRRREGLTQSELAAAVGIHQANVARVESGDVLPTLDALVRLVAGAGYELRLVLSKKSAQIETTL